MVAYAGAAAAEQGIGGGAAIAFHIPVQPLASALQTYGRLTGIQVLYESKSAAGQRSSAIDGTMTPDAALNALLAGTDLRVRYVQSDTITLASIASAAPGSTAPEPLAGPDLSLGTLRVRGPGQADTRLQDYSTRLRAEIQDALRKNPRTREGSYRVVLDIWIDPTRTVERTKVSRSTGDNDRDVAITTALRGLTVSEPVPPNAPQPIRVAIIARSSQ